MQVSTSANMNAIDSKLAKKYNHIQIVSSGQGMFDFEDP